MFHVLHLFFDVVPRFAISKVQFINEIDSLTASRKLTKSHLIMYLQNRSNLSVQYNILRSLLYSGIE